MEKYRRYSTHSDGNKRSYDIRVSTIGAIAIIAVDVFLLVFFSTHFGHYNYLIAIGSVGIVTFIGVLCLADYVSIEEGISTGEMRAAITASITSIYVVIVALTFYHPNTSLSSDNPIIKNFTWVMETVVIFYFGSKAVLQYREKRTAKTSSST